MTLDDPKTLAERGAVAQSCTTALKLTLPTVVDDMHDTVNQTYGAWPERIYVIDRAGKIAFKGGIGPFGFDPEAAAKALAKLLAKPGRGVLR